MSSRPSRSHFVFIFYNLHLCTMYMHLYEHSSEIGANIKLQTKFGSDIPPLSAYICPHYTEFDLFPGLGQRESKSRDQCLITSECTNRSAILLILCINTLLLFSSRCTTCSLSVSISSFELDSVSKLRVVNVV